MNINKEIKELNKQLYPTGRAWNFVHGSEQVDTEITEFVDGLNNPFVDGFGNHFISIFGSEASPSKRLINAFLESYITLYTDILSILNTIIPDNDEFSTVDAGNWERVYAILTNSGLTLTERKQAIIRKIAYPNGIPERAYFGFVQDQLQANGFDVYVTENRFSDGGSGWIVKDPDDLPRSISNSVFENKSFDVSTQDDELRGIFLKPDGTKLYVLGLINNEVFEYDLSTAFDISTAVYSSDSFDVSTQTSNGQQIFINNDGSLLFVMDAGAQIVYKYTFGTPWLTSTLSYSGQSYNSSTQVSGASGLFFSEAGDKMFISDVTTPKIFQYSLSSAFDLTTVTYDTISLSTSSILGITFSEDGLKLFHINGSSNRIEQYDLTTAWDISTASFLETFSLVNEGTGPQYIYMLNNGTKYYVTDVGNDEINQYKTDFDYQIAANFINETKDEVFFDSPATLPTESGEFESGFAESGNTIGTLGDTSLRFTFFIGSNILGYPADVPAERKDEFRQLILSLKPAHSVAYTFINYTI